MCKNLFFWNGDSPFSVERALLFQSVLFRLNQQGGVGITRFIGKRGRKKMVSKTTNTAKRFVASGNCWKVLSRSLATGKVRALMAHSRWPTQGDVCLKNTHPFLMKMGMGQHNGVLYNSARIAKEFCIKEELVDSHTFLRAIDAEVASGVDIVDAIEDVSERVSTFSEIGAFFYSLKGDDKVYFFRDDFRPLECPDARSIGMGCWILSDSSALKKAWRTLSGAIPPFSKKKVKKLSLLPGTIYTLSLRNGEIAGVGSFAVYRPELVSDLLPGFNHKAPGNRYFRRSHERLQTVA